MECIQELPYEAACNTNERVDEPQHGEKDTQTPEKV